MILLYNAYPVCYVLLSFQCSVLPASTSEDEEASFVIDCTIGV